MAMTEKMLQAMRVLRAKADGYHKEARALSPTEGRIPVGSAHIHAYQKGEALCAFLRLLSLHAPSDALFFAKEEAKLIADNWNAHHGYQTAVPITGADSLLEDAYRAVIVAENDGHD
jgi:hypothetical protein